MEVVIGRLVAEDSPATAATPTSSGGHRAPPRRPSTSRASTRATPTTASTSASSLPPGISTNGFVTTAPILRVQSAKLRHTRTINYFCLNVDR